MDLNWGNRFRYDLKWARSDDVNFESTYGAGVHDSKTYMEAIISMVYPIIERVDVLHVQWLTFKQCRYQGSKES